jgi:hypothetical protein
LLSLSEPRPYVRRATGSRLVPYVECIAAMLVTDPTVIRERLQPLGYRGGIRTRPDGTTALRLRLGQAVGGMLWLIRKRLVGS